MFRDMTDRLNAVPGYASKARAQAEMEKLLSDTSSVAFVTRNDSDRWVIVLVVNKEDLQLSINATHMNKHLIAIGG